MFHFVGNPEDKFCRVEAHIMYEWPILLVYGQGVSLNLLIHVRTRFHNTNSDNKSIFRRLFFKYNRMVIYVYLHVYI